MKKFTASATGSSPFTSDAIARPSGERAGLRLMLGRDSDPRLSHRSRHRASRSRQPARPCRKPQRGGGALRQMAGERSLAAGARQWRVPRFFRQGDEGRGPQLGSARSRATSSRHSCNSSPIAVCCWRTSSTARCCSMPGVRGFGPRSRPRFSQCLGTPGVVKKRVRNSISAVRRSCLVWVEKRAVADVEVPHSLSDQRR